ncbi:small ubiquitin-related modifier 2-like [Enhydra lutris kenyoni]|uniref:Small ubiquitin-related modifier 2-like n=1 Tax=Enhydra lutris kenyoni TaxID=391180 RepID=A0A2Y9IPI0_ENHLU|nr:small ubiquitin-related modifier 2-like [Enhydra lutris kenyoni]
MADKKPKEGVKTENNDRISLKVVGQDGSVVQFKIKKDRGTWHTPLNELMKGYCERQDTPAQLEMEAEDTIDVFQQQTGNDRDDKVNENSTGNNRAQGADPEDNATRRRPTAKQRLSPAANLHGKHRQEETRGENYSSH